MKLNYTFIKDLYNILFSQGDAWNKNIKDDIKNKQDKIDSLKAKSLDTSGLESSIARLQKNLNEGIYGWNIKPFNDVSNAQFLLANIHLLEDSFLIKKYNPQALFAIKNMLRENFSKIYNETVFKHKSELICMSPNSKTHTILKILEPQLCPEPFVPEDFFLSKEELDEFLSSSGHLIESTNLIDRIFLSEVATFWAFISKSYEPNDNILFSIMLPLSLAICFNNMDDIDNFLKNHVDYSSSESIEDSFILPHTIESIRSLTPYVRTIWSKINATYGKKAMIIFAKQNDIVKVTGKDFDALFREHDNDVNKIFTTLEELSKQSQFTNATKNQALADMAYKYQYSEDSFNRIVDEIIPQAKTSDNLPDVNFVVDHRGQHFQFQKLPAGDIRGLFLGKMTGCCQSIGGDAEKVVIDAFTRQDAGFYVLIDQSGKVKAQSLAWIGTNIKNEKVLVLDSFEHNKDVAGTYIPVMKQLYSVLKTEYQNFAELHVGSGGKTPNTKTTQMSEKITPPDGMHRYEDSIVTYLITENVSLAKDRKIYAIKYTNLDEYIYDNFVVAFSKMKDECPEFLEHIYNDLFCFPWYDAKSAHLIRESEALRTFLKEQMKPDSDFMMGASNYWYTIQYGCNKITTADKLSIIKLLLDSGCEMKELIAKFSAVYYINPAMLEYVGCENFYKLQNTPFLDTNTVLSILEKLKEDNASDKLSFLKNAIEKCAGARLLDPEELDKIIQENALSNFMQERNWVSDSDPYFQIKVSMIKIILEKDIPRSQADSMIISIYALMPIIEKGLDISSSLELWNGNSFYTPVFREDIQPTKQVEIIKAVLDAGMLKYLASISSLLPCILNQVEIPELVKILELFELYEEGSVPYCFSYYAAESNQMQPEFLEHFGIKQLLELTVKRSEITIFLTQQSNNITIPDRISLIEFINATPYQSRIYNNMLSNFNKVTHLIPEIGINDALRLCTSTTELEPAIRDVTTLKMMLSEPIALETLDISMHTQIHSDKIHIAQHIIMKPYASFTTKFPILGWYANVQENVLVFINNCGKDNEVYEIANAGDTEIILDHI